VSANPVPARQLRRVLALAAGLAVALLAWALGCIAPGAAAKPLAAAHFSEIVDDALAQRVALPHRWAADCAQCRAVWYRFDIVLPEAPREAQAIYFPAVGDNVALYLNGRLIGQSGRFTVPVARSDRRPFLVSAPTPLWNAGRNRLFALVKTETPRRGFLPAAYLGPEEAMGSAFQLRMLLRVTLLQVVAAATAMLGLVMILLGVNRRRESAYGWFAAACLAWAAFQAADLQVLPPLSAPAWDGLLSVLFVLAASLLLVAVRRLVAIAPARLERWWMLAPLAAAAATAAAAAAALQPAGIAAELATGGALLLVIAAGMVLLRAGWRASGGKLWLLAPGVALAALAAHDLIGLLGLFAPERGELVAFALLPLIVVGGSALLSRFVDTLNAAELLNVDLESLVRVKTRELETQFERVRQLEHAQAIAGERERLMRDMHDGVGGSLVSLLAMIETRRSTPPELAAAVRGALDDLRLMIDSLEPVDDDLNAVLAMLRDRLVPRLRAAGVELACEFDKLPVVAQLTPARVLNLLRLLQEAVTNALKHGAAQTITLTAVADGSPAGAIRIEIRDDGRGFDTRLAPAGRGLKNMARRAADAGASFHLSSAPGQGTQVTVELSAAAPR
jgi:signal transduction histidine kinase